MHAPGLVLPGLMVVAFSFATWLEPWFQGWDGNRTQSANVLAVALGDSRKLFANHVYLKADAYFHNGFYPTIYDAKEGYEKPHISGELGLKPEAEDEAAANFLGQPRDWIDRWSRSFFPSRHTHVGEADAGGQSCSHAHKEGETCEHEAGRDEATGGTEREILPWLRLSAELDPQRVETYVVSAYWLRTSLNKVDEAEQFLREGLQANPGNSEILFELGRIYYENKKDYARARNVWELAQVNWRKDESVKPEPNLLPYAQTTGHLATLEEKEGHYARAIEHLMALKVVSPNKDSIQKWIEDVKAKQLPAKP